jgi:hypothetical protein
MEACAMQAIVHPARCVPIPGYSLSKHFLSERKITQSWKMDNCFSIYRSRFIGETAGEFTLIRSCDFGCAWVVTYVLSVEE